MPIRRGIRNRAPARKMRQRGRLPRQASLEALERQRLVILHTERCLLYIVGSSTSHEAVISGICYTLLGYQRMADGKRR